MFRQWSSMRHCRTVDRSGTQGLGDGKTPWTLGSALDTRRTRNSTQFAAGASTMILKTLELTNFRSYHGRHVINLSPQNNDTRRNIAAIGGLNGAGKTTLLEAITFGLLGVADAFSYL